MPIDTTGWAAIIIAVFAGLTSLGTLYIQGVKMRTDARIIVLEAQNVTLHQQITNETTARQESDKVKDGLILALQRRIEELVQEVSELKAALKSKTAESDAKDKH